MSGKAKTAAKGVKGLACSSHGRGSQCVEDHPAHKMTKVLEFRRNGRGNVAPRYRFEEA